MNHEELAAVGYAAYAARVEEAFKDTHALPLPKWEMLNETHRAAWVEAAKAIRARVNES